MSNNSLPRDLALLGLAVLNPLLDSENRRKRAIAKLVMYGSFALYVIFFISFICVAATMPQHKYSHPVLYNVMNTESTVFLILSGVFLGISLSILFIPTIFMLIGGEIRDIKGGLKSR